MGFGILYIKISGFLNGICYKVLISKEEKSGCFEKFFLKIIILEILIIKYFCVK